MSELNLSDDAKKRMWQCYSLLLRLAEEAEIDTTADSELFEGHKPAAATEANKLTRPDHDTSEAWPGQLDVGPQSRQHFGETNPSA